MPCTLGTGRAQPALPMAQQARQHHHQAATPPCPWKKRWRRIIRTSYIEPVAQGVHVWKVGLWVGGSKLRGRHCSQKNSGSKIVESNTRGRHEEGQVSHNTTQRNTAQARRKHRTSTAKSLAPPCRALLRTRAARPMREKEPFTAEYRDAPPMNYGIYTYCYCYKADVASVAQGRDGTCSYTMPDVLGYNTTTGNKQ